MTKLHIGRPLASQMQFNEEWRETKIFDKRSLCQSLGIGLFTAVIFASAWKMLKPESLPLGSPDWSEILVTVTILAIGHELLHLTGFPCFGFDTHTVIGFWPEFGSPYVQYLSPMSRKRFLFATTLPFLVLTISPLILASYDLGLIHYLSWISVLNCIGSGSDILVFIKALSMTPEHSWIMESDDTMHWRPE